MMPASDYHLLLAAIVLLLPSAVDSTVGSVYPGGVYSKTPVYCDTNSQHTILRENTACFHKLTRATCCMKTYTTSENGIIHQECLCGPSNNEAPVITTTQTTTKLATTAAVSTASTFTTTPTRTSTSTTTRTTASTPTTTRTTASTPTTTRTTASTPTTTRTTASTPTTTRTTASTPTTTRTTASTPTTTRTTTSTPTTTRTTASTPTTTRTTASTPTTTRTTTSTSTTTTTTTSTPTTTPTTAATTARILPTTVSFQSLCTSSSFRLMNGEVVENHCQFSGVANITQGNGSIQTCNAVYTRAKVNDVFKPTFFTSRACTDGIQKVTESNIKTEIQIGNQAYPLTYDMFRLVEGPSGSAFIDIIERYARLLTDLDTCQKMACPYSKDKMAGLLNFNECKIVSWGASSAAPAFTQRGLHEAAIKLTPDGCSGIKDLFGASNTMCFRAISGNKLFSLGDSGAPVYCKASGEWILVGVAAEQLSWGTTADLKVIPYPE